MPRVAVESAIRRAARSRALLAALAALLAAPSTAEPVRLQLKWQHQFQFAGYYAAQAQGYYAAEGLDVTILEGGPGRPPIEAVVSGRADFGVGDAEILLARLRGAPLVALAAVFQHSPYVLVSRKDRGIRTPADLVGARVMLADEQGAGQLRVMLRHEGIDPARVAIVDQSWRLEDLADGTVDAMSGYGTVDPARLRALGVEPSVLTAVDYGVDFYGDALFTTEDPRPRGPPGRRGVPPRDPPRLGLRVPERRRDGRRDRGAARGGGSRRHPGDAGPGSARHAPAHPARRGRDRAHERGALAADRRRLRGGRAGTVDRPRRRLRLRAARGDRSGAAPPPDGRRTPGRGRGGRLCPLERPDAEERARPHP